MRSVPSLKSRGGKLAAGAEAGGINYSKTSGRRSTPPWHKRLQPHKPAVQLQAGALHRHFKHGKLVPDAVQNTASDVSQGLFPEIHLLDDTVPLSIGVSSQRSC